MQNNPIKIMLDEHTLISSSHEFVKKLDNRWVSDPQEYKAMVLDLLTFLRKYADGVHHRKEEEVLFPAIRNHIEFTLPEIIDELEGHHEDFRSYAASIEEAVKTREYEKSYQILTKYVDELQDHIAVENDELFVMAENLMDEEQLEKIYFDFQDIDREVGIESIEKLEGYIKKLSQITSR